MNTIVQAKLLAAQKNIHVIIDDTATTIVNTASSIHSRQQVVELGWMIKCPPIHYHHCTKQN